MTKLHGVIGLADLERSVGGLSMAQDRLFRLKLPEQLAIEDMQRMQNDFQGIADILRDNPEKMKAIFDALSKNEIRDAVTIAHEIGLTEKEFSDKGGGLVWVVFAAVFFGILLFTSTVHEAFGAAADYMFNQER